MNKDPWLVKIYEAKHKLDIESENEKLWLQGLYIHNAVGVCISNALSKKKQKYLEKPIRLFPETEDEKKANAEIEKQKFVNLMKKKLEKFKNNIK